VLSDEWLNASKGLDVFGRDEISLQADACVDAKDIFTFLEKNEIGQDHALFYEAYATNLELRRNYAKANEVYERGIAR
jgi:hypothetical protein